MIKSFKINNFRGIHNLSIEHLNKINIITGENNSGKTRILETLLLLKNSFQSDNLHEIICIKNEENILLDNKNSINIEYVTPIKHLCSDITNPIIHNKEYKDKCVKMLQFFDNEIEDILILKNTANYKNIDFIKHQSLGIMPLNTFGNGIKQALTLAKAVIRSKDGMLLVDEVEISIHKNLFDKFFRFFVKACSEFNVQAFITTHSIEAIDGLLATQDYQKQVDKDDISVITIKKAAGQTHSRVLTGREAATNRETFGFEVRL